MISRASGPCDLANATAASSGPANQAILPRRRLSQNQTVDLGFQVEHQADVLGTAGRDEQNPPVIRGWMTITPRPSARAMTTHFPADRPVDPAPRVRPRTPGVAALEQERVDHPDVAQDLPASAGRSPRTIVSTSGKSGMAPLRFGMSRPRDSIRFTGRSHPTTIFLQSRPKSVNFL